MNIWIGEAKERRNSRSILFTYFIKFMPIIDNSNISFDTYCYLGTLLIAFCVTCPLIHMTTL